MASDLLMYLVKSTVVFVLLFCIYRISVSKLTFHGSNRAILLLLPILSVTIPLVDVATLLPTSTSKTILPFVEFVPFDISSEMMTSSAEEVHAHVPATSWVNYTQLLLLIYSIGVIIMAIRYGITLVTIFKIKRKASPIVHKGKEVFLAEVASPFSYFNWIFMPASHFRTIHDLVIEHETTHVKLKHSIDLLLVELFTIAFWFNPVLSSYRKNLKALHEFQADAAVLKKDVKTSEYLQLVYESIQGKNTYHSLSYFNNPLIKKRIEMMTKTKSKKHFALTYVLLLFGVIFISIGFSAPEVLPNSISDAIIQTEVNFVEPPSIFPLKDFNPKNITSGFGKEARHPKTRSIMTHTGMDIKAVTGTPVLATADGAVAKAALEGDWGNLIVISHSEGYQTRYAHLDKFEVAEGDTVNKGDIIGYVGNTGVSTGPHLHYEVRKDNRPLNPADFFTK